MKDSKRTSSIGGEYTVGYGRPPQHTRFQPGRSGNPKGRPKGSKSVSTLFAEELAQTVNLIENGRRKKMSKRQALVKQTVNKALSNVEKAVALVFDEIRRCEELAPVQQVNMNITAEEFEAIARKVASEI
jgi:Family of unknown function (DUF5681)